MSQPRCAQVGQQREQVRLGARDAGDLLGVQDDQSAVRPATRRPRRPSARRSGRASTRARSSRPSASRSASASPRELLRPGRRRRRGRSAAPAAAARRSRCSRRAPACTSPPPRRRPCRALPRACCSRARPSREQRRNVGVRGTGSSTRAPRAPRAASRSARSSAVSDGPRSSSSTSASAAARTIVSSPSPARCGRARPRAAARPAARSTHAKRVEVDPVPDRDDLRATRAGTSWRSTLSTAVDDALGERRASRDGFQCVNQSSSGTRRGRASGAGEHRVAAGSCARAPRRAARAARARAPRRTAARGQTRGRAVEPNAAVRRQHAVDGARGEHDHLVEARGERADLRAPSPPSTGCARVDLLRRRRRAASCRDGSQEVEVAELEVRPRRDRMAERLAEHA